MYKISNFTDNNDVKVIEELGPFKVIEYQRDLSVTPMTAQVSYFSNLMNVRKRQVICNLGVSSITTQSGAMQWMIGNVNATTGVKGVGDLFSKAVRGKVTGESAIKPEYTGDGLMMLEPTYKHILLLNLDFRDIFKGCVLMSVGLLKINVFNESVGAPVPDANIKVMKMDENGSIVEEMITNISGQSDIIELEAPPIDYSLTPNSPKP